MGFYLALRLGLGLARLLPAGMVIGGGAVLGRLASWLSPTRPTAGRNLAAIAAAGGTRSGAGDLFAAYGRYWGEFLALTATPGFAEELPISADGWDNYTTAAQRGPVCLLTGHLGNWDLLAAWLGRRVPHLTVVAERLRPPALYELFAGLRAEMNLTTLPADGSGRKLYRALQMGHTVGLLADRVFGRGSGQRAVPFLGGRRSFPSSGMDLARRAGASLLPVFLLRRAGGYVIKVHPPLAETEDPVAGFARILEREIIATPDQWCVLYPLHDGPPAKEQ